MTTGSGASTNGVTGAKLLDDVRRWLATYICTMADADLHLLALWAAHTHLLDECYTTPRLQVDSPVPEAGKTTVLEHLQRICRRSVQMAALSSPALLTRMLDQEQRTILIDEVDRSLDPKKDGIADLIAVLNSGYKRGATRPVLIQAAGSKWEVKEMPTFAAVGMAGNNPNLPDDTRTRTIRVLLLPDLDGIVQESDWEVIESQALRLHDRLVRWADQVREAARSERPELPDGITGRLREKWAPLKRVAVAAGGSWPDRVDAMALHDKKQREMDREDGLIQEKPQVVLLHHIRQVWPKGVTFLATEKLIAKLIDAHPEFWSVESSYGKALIGKRLGSMLARGYKIHSGQPVRGGPRGYHFSAFVKPWHHMRTPLPQSDASDANAESDAADSSSDSPDASLASDSRALLADVLGAQPVPDRAAS